MGGSSGSGMLVEVFFCMSLRATREEVERGRSRELISSVIYSQQQEPVTFEV